LLGPGGLVNNLLEPGDHTGSTLQASSIGRDVKYNAADVYHGLLSPRNSLRSGPNLAHESLVIVGSSVFICL
jgi:hypothetical protein